MLGGYKRGPIFFFLQVTLLFCRVHLGSHWMLGVLGLHAAPVYTLGRVVKATLCALQTCCEFLRMGPLRSPRDRLGLSRD